MSAVSGTDLFHLQDFLFSGVADALTLRDGQIRMLADLMLQIDAHFGVAFQVDRVRRIAEPVALQGAKIKLPPPWRLDGREGEMFTAGGLLRAKEQKTLLFPGSVVGANLVIRYPHNEVPVSIARLEWRQEPQGLDLMVAGLQRLCRSLGAALKLLEDREAAERMRDELVELQEATSGIEEELDDLELMNLLCKILKIAQGRVPAQHLCVFLCDSDALVLEPKAYVGDLIIPSEQLPRKLVRRSKVEARDADRRARPGASGTFFQALDAKESYLCHDADRDPHFTPLFRKTRSSLSVPILLADRAVGVLLVEAVEPKAFAHDHARALEDLARVAAIYIAKAHVYRQTLLQDPDHPLELICQPHRVIEEATYAAASHSPVMLEGESGSGKGVLARYMHRLSPRHAGPFVSLNCGTLSESLLLSQLFGHAKGAFTGADRQVQGMLASADHGTLFIDDIEVLPLEAQARLLEFLDGGSFTPLGDRSPCHVDVRVITASNIDLAKLTEAGRFRLDLYHRLSVLRIHTVPLRRVARTLPRLIEMKLPRIARLERKRQVPTISPAAMALLKRYSWPGNYREVEAVLHRLVVRDSTGLIDVRDLPEEVRASARSEDAPEKESYEEAKADFEKCYLIRLLRSCNGNLSRAARRAGMTRPLLYKKLSLHNINPEQFRSE
ncbi:MAG: sigma-54-dependent Fis family transcriptional regulator [Planctomycetes bacterium]|nr:sigma-54-dependent Fis family transcriptional regulator [Planctomycetota bacterium]